MRKLKERIANENIDESKAKEMLDKYNVDRMDFASSLFNNNEYLCYFPARSLPKDSVLVVRVEELLKFEKTIKCSATNKETTSQRQHRLKNRILEERAKGTKAFLRTVAKEEDISISRLKQLTSDVTNKKSSWLDLQTSNGQPSSKRKETKY